MTSLDVYKIREIVTRALTYDDAWDRWAGNHKILTQDVLANAAKRVENLLDTETKDGTELGFIDDEFDEYRTY